MIIALILAIVLTNEEHINNHVSYYHFLLTTDNLSYVKFILKLHVIRCKLYESDIQKYQVYFLLISLFANYLVTGNEKPLYGFLVILYSNIYCEYFILRVMPYSILDMDEVSVVMEFLTNLRYRYLDNKFPILLGGDKFNEYRGYCFRATTEEFFNYMHLHYMRIECCEYLADHSIPLGEKLKGCQERLQNYKDMVMTDETKLMIDILIGQIDLLEYLLEDDPDYLEYLEDWLKEEAEWDAYVDAYVNSDSDDSDDQEF